MTYSDETIRALATLREAATHPGTGGMLRQAINTLDNAGVFAVLDEQTDYASAEEILAEVALASVPNTADPAEWGDTTSADMARHQGYAAVSALGKLERVPGTDTLRPAPEDAGEWSEDVVQAAFPSPGWHPRTPDDLKQSQETSAAEEANDKN